MYDLKFIINVSVLLFLSLLDFLDDLESLLLFLILNEVENSESGELCFILKKVVLIRSSKIMHSHLRPRFRIDKKKHLNVIELTLAIQSIITF
jgi:hypothetical protein